MQTRKCHFQTSSFHKKEERSLRGRLRYSKMERKKHSLQKIQEERKKEKNTEIQKYWQTGRQTDRKKRERNKQEKRDRDKAKEKRRGRERNSNTRGKGEGKKEKNRERKRAETMASEHD